MFNAPRKSGGNPLAASAFFNSSMPAASYPDPLAQSTPNPGTLGEVDPWSAVPSPSRSGTPRTASDEVVSGAAEVPPSMAGPGKDGLQGLISAQ